MTRAFIVTLELNESDDPNLIAVELENQLTSHFDVTKVNPWDSPTSNEILAPIPFPTL